jgi:hypothetical protein
MAIRCYAAADSSYSCGWNQCNPLPEYWLESDGLFSTSNSPIQPLCSDSLGKHLIRRAICSLFACALAYRLPSAQRASLLNLPLKSTFFTVGPDSLPNQPPDSPPNILPSPIRPRMVYPPPIRPRIGRQMWSLASRILAAYSVPNCGGSYSLSIRLWFAKNSLANHCLFADCSCTIPPLFKHENFAIRYQLASETPSSRSLLTTESLANHVWTFRDHV